MSLPLPPENPYAKTRPLYLRRVWDARDIPMQQEREGVVVITPTAGQRIVIYGRACAPSPYAEDRVAERQMEKAGRFMGEWFSAVCPEGELGTAAWADCEQISAEDFSAAYERGWEE